MFDLIFYNVNLIRRTIRRPTKSDSCDLKEKNNIYEDLIFKTRLIRNLKKTEISLSVYSIAKPSSKKHTHSVNIRALCRISGIVRSSFTMKNN